MSEVVNYHGLFVVDEEVRTKRVNAEIEQREKENKFRDSIVAENKAEMAEREQKAREQMFIADAELAFFKANPEASESDFKRLLPKIKDEFLLGNFRDAVRDSKPEWFDSELN